MTTPPETRVDQVLANLRSVADPTRLPGMARVGINVDRALGVSIPSLRRLGRRYRIDHALALALWETEVHEARILASMVDDPALVTRDQMEDWVADFDSWDLCDQVCSNLFDATPFAKGKVREWTRRPEEYVKRAGFTLIAALAAHDHTSPDRAFTAWFPVIRHGASDERNYVKKAVSWALRGIGKRSVALNAAAIAEAEHLLELDSSSARWIARDALRELRSDAVLRRLSEEP
jgi:3-methyladenine DNA glycosylase AlkD